MEIGAFLARLELSTSDPPALARFHATAFRCQALPAAEGVACRAPGRDLVFVPGTPGQLHRVSFRFHDRASFVAHRDRLQGAGMVFVEDDDGAFTVRDPQGHLVSMLAPLAVPEAQEPDARLQHFALRTPSPATLAAFYEQQLGFTVSDRVHDDQGELTAIFLRTDSEHHALALFRAPEARFDHFSCEVADWTHLRDWADHMARSGIDLAWGIGRHGPGNDTFFMVRDADGNMGEISAELEVCQPGRVVGVWPHRPQTLNQWGVAIMRS